ncbi:MAG: hypothetical protein JXX29_06285 [Deltaproteobacteria bacterium]|nr:hypothetical protein [Deltaproteobacteria bacterium]MBN2671259.1 hypothetical protein [Deltaproteobacteria bacterium]
MARQLLLCDSLRTAVTLVVLLAAACDNAPEDNISQTEHHFPAAAAQCSVPSPPAPLGSSTVIGNGTTTECTAAALATAVASGGNISFNCGEEITIPIPNEITVPADTIIDGGNTVTLDGGGSTRIFHTDAGVSLTVQNLRFSNGNAMNDNPGSGGAIRVGWLGKLYVFDCTFINNRAAQSGIEGGGAIYQSNGGELVVVRSRFEGNTAISGGAIDNLLSPMTIVHSSFVENESVGGGGAVYTDGASAYTDDDDDVGGVISICGCTFDRNRAVGTGGAVYLWAYPPDELFINHCSFTANEAYAVGDDSALGGAVRTGNAPLQMAHSLFAENHADVHGGAYWTRGNYPTQIVNCTFYRNTAGVEGRDGGYGGALSGFNTHVESCTFVENHAQFTGGAISAEENQWTMNNCVFLNNWASNPWGTSQTCTRSIDGAHSVQWPAPETAEDPPCGVDTIIADPLTGELGDHGGVTQTIPLLPNSPCINAGSNCPATDQRNEPRTGPCDIGAFEVQ